jgi:hypothetical protein
MAQWVKNLVVLVVLAVWATFMAVALVRGTPVDAIVWGVPSAVWFALNPTWPGRGGNQDQAADGAAVEPGGGAP